MIERALLRAYYKAYRESLDTNLKKNMDDLIALNAWKLIKNYRSIAIYKSFNSEVSTNKIIDLCWDHSIDVFLPVVEEKELKFSKFLPSVPLKENVYGIKEPVGSFESIQNIEAVIVPMLAYNSEGYRLGYGGGYYDRALQNYKGLIIGFAYDGSLSEQFMHEDHDIPCHFIITNREVISFQ